MLRILIAVLLTLGTTIGAAAEKRPFSVDDIYRNEQITDFKISPRGDEAIYVRHFYDVNVPTRRTALWRIDGATGRREPLEPGEPDGRMPVYSPDGKRLAFVSSRAEADGRLPFVPLPRYSEPVGAIWVLVRDPDDESFELVAQRQSYAHYQVLADPFYGRISFGPDGKTLLAAASSMYGSRDDAEDFQSRDVGRGVVKAEDQGEGYEGLLPTGICEFQARGFMTTHSIQVADPVTAGVWFGDPQWLRTGNGLICHVNRTDDKESVRYSINKNYDLWMSIHEKDLRFQEQILTTNPGPDVSPRVSPDGKHVLYLSVPRKGPHMDVFNLCVLSLDADKPEPRIIVNAHDAEREADGTPPFQPTFPLRDDCWIDNEHVRITGVRGMKTETVVFNIAGPSAPISAEAAPEPTPHTNPHFKKPDANPWLAERLHGPQEVVRWRSFDGLEIEGVLTLPPLELKQFTKPYPVIVHPHGGPHGANKLGFDLNVQIFASAGYAVFQPNYRGSYGYGRKFLDAARFDMGGSDMQDILTGVDKLIADGTVDAKRQYVFGSSYGGYSTCRLITLTDRFKAAVAQNAVTDLHAMWRLSDLQSWTEWEFGGKPWEKIKRDGKEIDIDAEMRDRSPTTHAHQVRTPTLLLHADHDRRCPLPMGQMFYRLLKENGVETQLVVYSDERHQLQQVKHQADALRRVLDWFAAHE